MNSQIMRVVKAPQSRDGWIMKDLDTGKVGFISNLNQVILLLRPGQIYDCTIVEARDTYDIVSLGSLVGWKADRTNKNSA